MGLALAAAGCADQAPAAPIGTDSAGLTTIVRSDPAAFDPGTDSTPPPAAPIGSLDIVPAPALQHSRYHHAAALVIGTGTSTGTESHSWVLVSGGENGSGGALASAERYDVGSGTWSEAGVNGGPAARTRHTATTLRDGSGRVLLTGGHTGGNGPALATAEIYDAASDEFRLVASLTVPRTGHTATALPDGWVLIAGGYDAAGQSLDTCELFNPILESFAPIAARLSAPRAHHAATALLDGRVLLSGGLSSARHEPIQVLASADLWNVSTGEVVPAGTMAAPRAEHTATLLLPSGLVLLAGGSTHEQGGRARNDAELFDGSPEAGLGVMGQFTPVSALMAGPRTGHTATLVPGSSVVLLIGGATQPHPELCPVTVGIERFVPDALGSAPSEPCQGLPQTALFVQPMGADGAPIGLPETAQGLTAHVAVLLPSGEVLVAGGADCAFKRPVAVARTALATDAAARQ